MTAFYTSDLHIGHRMVAGIRGFYNEDEVDLPDPTDLDSARARADPEAHDAEIARYWDETVHTKDTVYVLGDIAVSRYRDALDWFQLRPGRKILISGNHDIVHPMHRRGPGEFKKWLEVFEYITPFERRKFAGRSVLLSHFPYTGEGGRPGRDRYPEYRLRDEGFPLLHGHTHGTERAHGHQFHVGWDAWHRFVTTEEIVEWVQELPE